MRIRTGYRDAMRGAVMTLVAVSGCVPPADLYLGEPAAIECSTRDDCSAGEICIVGACVVATCDPSLEQACDAGTAVDVEFCCADREVCSTLSFTCVADPDAPPCEVQDITCVECASDAECVGGQFCTSGLCLEFAGREQCSSSVQCSDEGERCDLNAFVCAPTRPCAACSPTSPHLCCAEGEVCDDDACVRN